MLHVFDHEHLMTTELINGSALSDSKSYVVFGMHVRIVIDRKKCMGCGNCVTVCPANRKADPMVAASGAAFSDNVVLKVINGVACVVNEELCLAATYNCSACEDVCPSGALTLIVKPGLRRK